MDAKIENLISIAGDQHKYQYISVMIGFLIWTNVDLNSIALPFLERQPEVHFLNPKTGEAVDVQLNYTICDYGKEHYNITRTYGYSWVSELDIECDKVKTGLVGSLLFCGVMAGSLAFQFFVDKFGRKNTTKFGLLGFVLYLIIETFMPNYIAMMVMFSVGGCIQILVALGSYLLASESISPKKRALYGSIIQTGFAACGIFFAVFFKYVESWRLVFYISAGLNVLTGILFHYYMVESPRFHIIHKNPENFVESLREIAGKNSRLELFDRDVKNEEHDLHSVMDYIKGGKRTLANKDIDITYTIDPKENLLGGDNEKVEINTRSYFDLVKYASVRYRFLTLCFFWMLISGNYYGLTIHIKNLPGDIYINNIFIYAFEACSYFFAGYVVDVKWIGRKRTICFFYLTGAVGFGVLLIDSLSDITVVTLTFICRFGVAGVFNVLYVYSLEIYPTTARAQGFGINSFSARIGSIVFPLVLELMADYVTLFFVIMNTLCFFLMLLMPETLGVPMLNKFIEENDDHKTPQENQC